MWVVKHEISKSEVLFSLVSDMFHITLFNKLAMVISCVSLNMRKIVVRLMIIYLLHLFTKDNFI